MERKLASIRRINQIMEHPNADALELAIVDGWQCVVAKGKHSAGELVVYFEVDSVLPPLPEYEFLRKSCYIKRDWLTLGEGFRIKTIKLRREISQGLVMFPEEVGLSRNVVIGDDVTEYLQVGKYDPPVPAQLAGKMKGNFPEFIIKTDQDRMQNCFGRILCKLRANELEDSWEMTTKLEGSSMTIYRKDGEFGVCSRNIDLKLEENRGNAFVEMFYELFENSALKDMPDNTAIQGELMGPGIQGNIEKFIYNKFFVFDVFDIDTQRYYTPLARRTLVSELLLAHVPILANEVELVELKGKHLLEMADGPSINAKLREGIVFKNRYDPSVSFKVISNKYLLKQK